ncbi:malectin domain-containing carbohydrate-binding protein [Zobellia laminariae]|uniref:malectin domain-containing carbohydrate-binding protein n=1 Tax=Zobellia laminariae TaxID=248906 RepID=UPI0026F4539D|nr:malectin domain-containing carbohydrate-binding protein [Zobellia laminariae]WKX75004.1 malectin domain-containing carbohydrate-binding protein [Zobellia laminariae]
MRRNLITKWFLLSMLFVSFIMVPVACSSDDGGTETEQTPDPDPKPEPEPEPEPAPVPDPTNENTIIDATAAAHANGVSTSTITVQLADADGKKLTVSGGVVALSSTGSSTLTDVTDNADGTYTATVSGTVEESIVVSGTLDGVAITSTVEITFNPDESNPAQEAAQSTVEAGPTLLRINCGGPEVTYGDVTFLEDQYFGANSQIFSNPFVTEIEGTEMDEIFLTERVSADGPMSKGPTTYDIPLTNGTYTVKLYFAEIYWGVENPQGLEGGVGSRIFNISMEEMEIFTGYDLFKEDGPASAGTRMYDVEVIDGELNIMLEATVNKPKISAIEIFGTGTIGS